MGAVDADGLVELADPDNPLGRVGFGMTINYILQSQIIHI